MKVHVAIRPAGWSFFEPYSDYWESPFYQEHPEWRCVDRDGTPVDRMSWAVPEVPPTHDRAAARAGPLWRGRRRTSCSIAAIPSGALRAAGPASCSRRNMAPIRDQIPEIRSADRRLAVGCRYDDSARSCGRCSTRSRRRGRKGDAWN